MTRQQQKTMEAFQHRGYIRGGMGQASNVAGSQQGDINTIAQSLITAAPATGPAAPFVAAAGALLKIVALFGPNPDNTITTGWVNQVEADVLQPNLAAWNALAPQDKTSAMQAYAMQIFTTAWNGIVQLCSNATLGSAGTSCIADRQQGACHWTLTGETPGVPPSNCGNWWTWYYFPIAQDPQVAANEAAATATSTDPNGATCLTSALVSGYCPAAGTSSTSTTSSGTSLGTTISSALGGMSPVMIGAALIVLALVVSE